jgi:hypothetical protein
MQWFLTDDQLPTEKDTNTRTANVIVLYENGQVAHKHFANVTAENCIAWMRFDDICMPATYRTPEIADLLEEVPVDCEVILIDEDGWIPAMIVGVVLPELADCPTDESIMPLWLTTMGTMTSDCVRVLE